MTDLILDERTRAMSVGDFLARAGGRPVRLIDAGGTPLAELRPAADPATSVWEFGTGDRSATGRPRGGETFPDLLGRLGGGSFRRDAA